MTASPRCVLPEENVSEAVSIMRGEDCGVVPVVKDGKLLGIVTDRDVALFLGANDIRPSEVAIARVMTHGVVTCHTSDSIDEVRSMMQEAQVRRIPVLDEEEKVVGIISMADLAREESTKDLGKAIQEISAPARGHNSEGF